LPSSIESAFTLDLRRGILFKIEIF
jgi:hypothetical protein